jgi:RluA family pseudouridine synthase
MPYKTGLDNFVSNKPETLDILYVDNHLLVIYKPAGMLSQADDTGDADVLTVAKQYIKEKYEKPGEVFMGLVHRLDRPVSGVMVLARTTKAASRLSEQFRQKTPDKRYLAVVEAAISGKGDCEDYLIKEDQKVRIVSSSYPKAQFAALSWQAIASQKVATSQKTWSLLEIELQTGRPHQIRVQLSSRKMPILGDFRYGAKHALDGRNLALHCYLLSIEHPTQKTRMTFVAPPPASWKGLFEKEIAQLTKKN